MRVLVTGATGLIGTALTDRLLAGDHTVIRLVRGAPTATTGRTRLVDVRWDPASGRLDQGGLEQAGPFDGVVNLAGAGIGDRRWTEARKKLILDSRRQSTSVLVDSLLRLSPPPPVLISASAVGVYGIRGDEELTEASPIGAGYLAEVCRTWEAATLPAVEAGVRTVLLRTGIVLSRTGGALSRQLPLFRIGLGGRMGPGTQFRSWITLEDEIAAILFCIGDADVAGPVNATAPVPATDGQLAKAVGAALHRPALVAVPPSALRLVLGREMATELVLGGQRVVPAVLSARGFAFTHTDLDEAVRSVLVPEE